MNFKQKVVSSAILACFIAMPAYANDYIDTVGSLVDDALDADDAMVRVISGALNFATIDASVSITAEQISITSGADASANATVTGIEGLTGVVNAISGNSIVTTAIGAVNDTTLDLANNVQYTANLSSDNDSSFINVDIDSDYNGSGDSSGGNSYNFDGILSFANIFGGFGGFDEDFGNGDYADAENGVAVFQAAYNAADINASVTIAAAPSYDLDSFWDRNRELAQNTIEMANININTTAIGAVNSGAVTVANALTNSLTATATATSVAQ